MHPAARQLLSPPAPPGCSLAAYLFYLYSQLEYVTAAMLTRHVPREGSGANVIQVGGGTKELFYYPKNTLQVTAGTSRSGLQDPGLACSSPIPGRLSAPGP